MLEAELWRGLLAIHLPSACLGGVKGGGIGAEERGLTHKTLCNCVVMLKGYSTLFKGGAHPVMLTASIPLCVHVKNETITKH